MNELTHREGGEMAAGGHTLLETIQRIACMPDANIDALERLVALQERSETSRAKQEFNAAVVRFQQQAPIIEKADVAYDKRYARMDRIWREIRPLMKECGLAITWETVDPDADKIILNGSLRHEAGHAQPLRYVMPMPDAMKGMNKAQQYGSATTYAKRYATCAVLGIQTGEDDDGNAAGGSECLSEQEFDNLERAMIAAGADVEKFKDWAQVDDLHRFPRGKYAEAMALLAERAAKRGNREDR